MWGSKPFSSRVCPPPSRTELAVTTGPPIKLYLTFPLHVTHSVLALRLGSQSTCCTDISDLAET